MRAAILSAFPQEMGPIITQFKATRDTKKRPYDIYRTTRPSSEIILIITGMGIANAEAAARYVHREFRPDLMLSVGYGGAIYEGAAIGDLVWGSRFILMHETAGHGGSSGTTITSLEIPVDKKIFDGLTIHEGTIVTLPALTSKTMIKRALPADILNPVCDMETFALANFCSEVGLQFFAVRSISDLHDEEIPPELGNISDSFGKYSVWRAIVTFVGKPQLLPVVFRLAGNSKKASQSLGSFVESFLKRLNVL